MKQSSTGGKKKDAADVNVQGLTKEAKAKKYIEETFRDFYKLSSGKNKTSERKGYEDSIFQATTAACNVDPENGQCFTYRGRYYMHMGDFQRAMYDFSASISCERSSFETLKDIYACFERLEGRNMMNYNYAGQCNHQLGQFQEALNHYNMADSNSKKIRSKSQNEETVAGEILFNRGINYCSIGGTENLFKALDDFEKALEFSGDKDTVVKHKTLFNLGIVYRKIGVLHFIFQNERGNNVDRTDPHCTRVLVQDSVPLLIPDKLAKIAKAEKNGMLMESIIKLQDAERNCSAITKAATLNNLGLSFFDLCEFYEAGGCFEKARQSQEGQIQENKGDLKDLAFYLNNIGLCHYHNADPEYVELEGASEEKLEENLLNTAIQFYDKAIEKNPNEAIFYFNRANVLLTQKKFEEALTYFDEATNIEPENPKFWHAKGLTFQANADLVDDKEEELKFIYSAIYMFERSQECSDDFLTAIFHHGLMQRRIGSHHNALRSFGKVMKKLPEDKTVHYQRGLVYQDMGNHDLAIKDFNSAIDLDSRYADALFHRASSLLKYQSVKEAIIDYKKAMDYTGDETLVPGIWDGQGLCFYFQHEYEKAIDCFDEAVSKDNSNIEFICNRARCYYQMKNYELSIRDLERAGEITNQEDPLVLYQLGLSYFASQKYKKCLRTLKDSLRMSPLAEHEPDIYYHIGISYCREQKFEKSIFPYSKSIDKVPSDLRYIHERAKAYQQINLHEEAVEDFDLVIKMNPKNAHAHFRRAFSLKSLKKFSQAADDFEKAKELDPMNPKMLVNYKKLKGVTCIVLCEPGKEKTFI